MSDTIRESILLRGIALTTGDRNKTYGNPDINLNNCAELISAFLRRKYPTGIVELTNEDIAIINILQKIARTYTSGFHEDNYIDMATYAAIAGECRGLKE